MGRSNSVYNKKVMELRKEISQCKGYIKSNNAFLTMLKLILTLSLGMVIGLGMRNDIGLLFCFFALLIPIIILLMMVNVNDTEGLKSLLLRLESELDFYMVE